MDVPPRLVRRWVALGLIAVFVAPLLAASHHHDVDHDGGVHHVEAAHGGHAPALSETDTKRPGGSLKLPVPALTAGVPELAGLPALHVAGFGPEEVGPPPRAPPGTSRSRAPPA